MWYLLKMGLPYQNALDLPHGETLDLIAVDQVKNSGFIPKAKDNDDFWELLEKR